MQLGARDVETDDEVVGLEVGCVFAGAECIFLRVGASGLDFAGFKEGYLVVCAFWGSV